MSSPGLLPLMAAKSMLDTSYTYSKMSGCDAAAVCVSTILQSWFIILFILNIYLRRRIPKILFLKITERHTGRN
jgi:hypothetical protein